MNRNTFSKGQVEHEMIGNVKKNLNKSMPFVSKSVSDHPRDQRKLFPRAFLFPFHAFSAADKQISKDHCKQEWSVKILRPFLMDFPTITWYKKGFVRWDLVKVMSPGAHCSRIVFVVGRLLASRWVDQELNSKNFYCKIWDANESFSAFFSRFQEPKMA